VLLRQAFFSLTFGSWSWRSQAGNSVRDQKMVRLCLASVELSLLKNVINDIGKSLSTQTLSHWYVPRRNKI
jgi:hypothetical protein